MAIVIADEEGLDAVTIRRVAGALGAGAMSLYRHVRTKDELFDVMVDTVAGESGGPPAAPSADWRADLRTEAQRLRTDATRHPWLVTLWTVRPGFGPNTLARLEFVLTTVLRLGVSIDDAASTVQTVHAFVRGFVQDELADRRWRGSPPAPESGLATYLRHMIESRKYPNFTRLATEADDATTPDERFGWQLDRVLDGLAATIQPPSSARNTKTA